MTLTNAEEYRIPAARKQPIAETRNCKAQCTNITTLGPQQLMSGKFPFAYFGNYIFVQRKDRWTKSSAYSLHKDRADCIITSRNGMLPERRRVEPWSLSWTVYPRTNIA